MFIIHIGQILEMRQIIIVNHQTEINVIWNPKK